MKIISNFFRSLRLPFGKKTKRDVDSGQGTPHVKSEGKSEGAVTKSLWGRVCGWFRGETQQRVNKERKGEVTCETVDGKQVSTHESIQAPYVVGGAAGTQVEAAGQISNNEVIQWQKFEAAVREGLGVSKESALGEDLKEVMRLYADHVKHGSLSYDGLKNYIKDKKGAFSESDNWKHIQAAYDKNAVNLLGQERSVETMRRDYPTRLLVLLNEGIDGENIANAWSEIHSMQEIMDEQLRNQEAERKKQYFDSEDTRDGKY